MLEGVGIGDLHLDKLDRVLPGIGNELIGAEVCKPLDYALKNGIQHAFFYGDVADKARMSYGAHKALFDSVLNPKYDDIHKWVILGNHDFAENGTHSLELLESVVKTFGLRTNLHVISQPLETKIDGVGVRFLPYPHTDTSRDFVNVGHFGVAGATGDNGRVMKDGKVTKHLCLLGHLHTPHSLGRQYFSGTLYQTNFGEAPKKGFHHFRVRPDLKHKVELVANKPAFRLINLTVAHKRDLDGIVDKPGWLYKLFIQDNVKLDVRLLDRHPGIIRVNKYKDDADLKTQLEDEWRVSEENPVVFQPHEDLVTFLTKKNVTKDLQRRVLDLHNKAMVGADEK